MPTARDGRDPQAVASWLRRHGKAKRAYISRDERADLAACFTMLDEDGSGAIDARGLLEAFSLLGIPATLEQCRRRVSEVDRDASGQVEFPEFVQLVTTTTTRPAAPCASERSAARVDDAAPLPFALRAVAHRRRKMMEQVRTNADGARVRLLERADEAARENHTARRYAEKTTRSFRSTTRPLDRSAPKYTETAEDRRARRERRRKSMAYSDGIPRRILNARCFPTRGGDAQDVDESVAGSNRDGDDDDDGIAVSSRVPEASVSVASARVARVRRALAMRLGTDLPELDPAGRRRAREGARRVARREEEDAAEAMRASGVIDAARASDAIVAAGIDVDEDDASEGIAATSRPYLLEDTDDDGSGTDSESERKTTKDRFEIRPALVDALGSLTAEEASAMRDALGSARTTTRKTTRLGIEPRTATRLATSREPLALTRDEMRRVRITERCLWEQRGDEDGSPASSPRGTTAKSLASSSRSALASVASTASPARRPGAAARAAALEAAKARGMFGESPEKPPPRFRTVFVGTPAGTSARDVLEDVVRGAASKSTRVDARRISRTTRLDGDSDRPAARRLETLARPSVVSASIGRAALRGVREEEVRMVGAGMERGRDAAGWAAAATGPLDLLNDAAAPGTAGQRGEGAMLVELGLPDVAFATVPMPARAADVVRGRG